MKQRLFAPIDNAPLILFRIFLGFLLAAETFGAIATGWVKSNFITPKFTFSFIGMEWLQPLPGSGMYYYFIVMGLLGLLVMVGYKYRFSMAAFSVLWAGVYFMQKTSYNNHYYLLLLVCIMMLFLPAHRYASIDARQNPQIKTLTMPAWCSWVMIVQVTIVYFFATLAKFYPGWLDGSFTRALLDHSVTIEALRPVMTHKWFYLFIAYAGIAFDGLIVPLMLYKRTRMVAFIASIIFHIFNSITLQIGIFPFFALSFAVFFFPPNRIRQIFFKKKPAFIANENTTQTFEYISLLRYFFIPYLIIQLILPLRHYFIKGDVLWTEEAHRLSWRMMLRNRSGNTSFVVIDKSTKEQLPYMLTYELTSKQKNAMDTRPDMIWQMAQRIKQHFAAQGKDVEVHAHTRVAVNSSTYKLFIDPNTDLAAVPWNYFAHCEWVLLYDDKNNPIK
jgi:hypothetical protein